MSAPQRAKLQREAGAFAKKHPDKILEVRSIREKTEQDRLLCQLRKQQGERGSQEVGTLMWSTSS